MGQEIEIQAVRYLPRYSDGSGNQNGFIQGYRIEVSVDGEIKGDIIYPPYTLESLSVLKYYHTKT